MNSRGSLNSEELEQRSHGIANAELDASNLPRSAAPWSELVFFAHTFDGYVVKPSVEALQRFANEAVARFRSSGQLPTGLTELRTALFAEQRRDHFTNMGGDPENMDFIHALVEGIRERVLSSDASTDPVAIAQDRVMAAFDRLVVEYARWGGCLYHGWTDYPEGRNYLGPTIWSERDIGLRFCMELEKEWSGSVHMEFPIGKATRVDYDPETEKRQFVDVAVSDLSMFAEDDTSQDRYVSHQHEAFFEVKWLKKGWRGQRFEQDAKKQVEAIPIDLAKLENHMDLGRCRVAGMVIFDDEGYFAEHGGDIEWPDSIWRLLVGEEALRSRGLLA